MATRSASTPADAQRPRPLFTALLGDDSFARLCELANGQVLPPGAFNGRLECRPHNRDAAKHDHDATPMPERPLTDWDILRVRLRWRHLHHDRDEPAA